MPSSTNGTSTTPAPIAATPLLFAATARYLPTDFDRAVLRATCKAATEAHVVNGHAGAVNLGALTAMAANRVTRADERPRDIMLQLVAVAPKSLALRSVPWVQVDITDVLDMRGNDEALQTAGRVQLVQRWPPRTTMRGRLGFVTDDVHPLIRNGRSDESTAEIHIRDSFLAKRLPSASAVSLVGIAGIRRISADAFAAQHTIVSLSFTTSSAPRRCEGRATTEVLEPFAGVAIAGPLVWRCASLTSLDVSGLRAASHIAGSIALSCPLLESINFGVEPWDDVSFHPQGGVDSTPHPVLSDLPALQSVNLSPLRGAVAIVGPLVTNCTHLERIVLSNHRVCPCPQRWRAAGRIGKAREDLTDTPGHPIFSHLPALQSVSCISAVLRPNWENAATVVDGDSTRAVTMMPGMSVPIDTLGPHHRDHPRYWFDACGSANAVDWWADCNVAAAVHPPSLPRNDDDVGREGQEGRGTTVEQQ